MSQPPAQLILEIARQSALAYTRPEIEAADAAFHSFKEQFPLYPVNPEMFHGWHNKAVALEERERQSLALGLTASEAAERESLLKSTLWWEESGDYYDAPRLAQWRNRLQAWLQRFPEDPAAFSRLKSIEADWETCALLDADWQEQEPLVITLSTPKRELTAV